MGSDFMLAVNMAGVTEGAIPIAWENAGRSLFGEDIACSLRLQLIFDCRSIKFILVATVME